MENSEIFEKDDSAPMGYTIKRPKSDKCTHKLNILKDGANFIIVNGATGSGKTTALLALLPCFTDELKHIILASAKYDDDVHAVIGTFCNSQNINFIYVHNTDETNEAIAKILDTKDEKEHMLCIFDDFNINYTSKGKDPYNEILIKVFALLRSAGCSGILLTQSYSNVPTKVRENVNIRICFELGNVFSYRAFVDDVVGMFAYTGDENDVRRDIKTLFSKVYANPHAFVIVSKEPKPQIRLGWKDIIYPEEVKKTQLEERKSQICGRGKGLSTRQELWKKAKEFDIEEWRFRGIRNEDLRKFIDSKGKIKLDSNDNSATFRTRLSNHIRNWKKTLNPKEIIIISELFEKLVKKNMMSIEEAKFIISRNDLSEEIDLQQ